MVLHTIDAILSVHILSLFDYSPSLSITPFFFGTTLGTLDLAELADFVERGAATFGAKGQGGGAAAVKWSGGVVVTEFEKQKAKARKEAARKKPPIPEEVRTTHSVEGCALNKKAARV